MTIDDKLKEEGHVCEPRPTQFFSVVTYQCGCGVYFTKRSYLDYCRKNKIQPILTLQDLKKSRGIGI